MAGEKRDGEMVQVPASVSFPELWEFALTYDGYGRHRFERVAEIGNNAAKAWHDARALPEDLGTARCVLFFEQRRHRHSDPGVVLDDTFYPPAQPPVDYLEALLQRIRELSSGAVPNENPVT